MECQYFPWWLFVFVFVAFCISPNYCCICICCISYFPWWLLYFIFPLMIVVFIAFRISPDGCCICICSILYFPWWLLYLYFLHFIFPGIFIVFVFVAFCISADDRWIDLHWMPVALSRLRPTFIFHLQQTHIFTSINKILSEMEVTLPHKLLQLFTLITLITLLSLLPPLILLTLLTLLTLPKHCLNSGIYACTYCYRGLWYYGYMALLALEQKMGWVEWNGYPLYCYDSRAPPVLKISVPYSFHPMFVNHLASLSVLLPCSCFFPDLVFILKLQTSYLEYWLSISLTLLE